SLRWLCIRTESSICGSARVLKNFLRICKNSPHRGSRVGQPDDANGRVAGFYTMAFLGIAPLGNLAARALAKAIGVQATFALHGVICALAAFWFWRRLPTLAAQLRPTYVKLGIITESS